MKLTALLLALLLALSLLFVACRKKQETPAPAPTDTTPADTTPADTTPADTTPADTTPADTTPADETPAETTPADDTPAVTGVWKDATYTEDTTLGEGETTFTFVVTADDKSVTFTIKTDKKMLDEALLEWNLIEGDSSEYGLYVKKVNGMTADWSVDQTWWELFENGESSMVGVSGIEVAAGANYAFNRTK